MTSEPKWSDLIQSDPRLDRCHRLGTVRPDFTVVKIGPFTDVMMLQSLEFKRRSLADDQPSEKPPA